MKIEKLLPKTIRKKIEGNPTNKRILENIGWLFSDKILRMGIMLVVGVWMARYLGPEKYGTLNYVIAFVGLFIFIPQLGLQEIVVRDLVNKKYKINEIKGTTFFLQLFSGLLAYFALLLIAFFTSADNEMTFLYIAIFGVSTILKCTEIVKYWFESKVLSKNTILIENASYVVIAGIKVLLIVKHASLTTIVWIFLLESFLIAVGYLIVYRRNGFFIRKWRFNIKVAFEMLKQSWPLMLASFVIVIYMRIDKIMLGQLLDNESVGIYSVATRLSELWYFVPTAIVTSFFPSIIKAKERSEKEYYGKLQKVFDLCFILSISIVIPVLFLSQWLVIKLFGIEYIESGKVLSIHILAGIFVFSGVASAKWFLVENLQKLTFYRTVVGGVINIGLNFLLIPQYGPVGAAWATVISQAFASLFFNILTKNTFPLFKTQIRAFILYSFFSKIK